MSASTSSASASLSAHAQCELRAVIRFLHSRGETPAAIHRQLCTSYGSTSMSIKNLRKSGRPSVSDNLQEQVESELREDRRVTVRELEEKLQIPKSSLHRIISDLGYRKCSSRWVPKMLTEDHKRQRIESSREVLELYAEEEAVFLNSIVTGDETWVYHFTPESKQQSMEWRHSFSPKKRKFKVTQSARKIMATVFWDRKGVLLIEFMPTRTTIIRHRIVKRLKNCVKP
ncbi:hypothetical protein QTP88_010543 [Uroleucon formosanum]